jgi:hypothetical protein
MIILKLILRKWDAKFWTGYVWLSQRAVAGLSGQCSTTSGYTKGREILDQSDCLLASQT